MAGTLEAFLDNEATLNTSQALKVAGQREGLVVSDNRAARAALLHLEKHILLMPLLFPVTVIST